MSERLDDGYSTKIQFTVGAGASGTTIWEKTVTPPGVSAGGEIDITTMHNVTWRTRNPKALKTLSNASFTAAYDPIFYDDLLAMIGVNQLITIEFPDGDSLDFWGWLDEFTPGANSEGEQPTADCTIIPSNKDNSGAEVAPIRSA
jgi:hypothetical protein